jgi:Arc/MetJ family transcription regulator
LISIGGATVRTVVEIDEDSLSEARAALGTTTKVETVNRALVEVAALAARRRDLTRLVSGEYSVLADEVQDGSA